MADVDPSGFQSLGDLLGGGTQMARLKGVQQGISIQDMAAQVGQRSAQTQQALASARSEQAKALQQENQNSALSRVSALPNSTFNDPDQVPIGDLIAAGAGANYSSAQEGRVHATEQLGDALTQRLKGVLADPANLNTPAATAAAAGISGKLPEPYEVHPEFALPAGVTPPVVHETPGGTATINQKTASAAASNARATASGPFSEDQSNLLGALAERGISLPAGLRSRQQMQSTLQSLLDRNPNVAVEDIADKIGNGQLDFGAARKETTTAAGVAGKVGVAENELGTFAPLVLQASAAVPRGSFMPINRLMQAADTQISDPNLLKLKIGINSMLNAYDMLAARGGTDVNKRAEAHALITSAQSPEALATGVQMFQQEAAAAKQAADQAIRNPSSRPRSGSAPANGPVGGVPAPPPSAPAPLANAQGWTLHTDKFGNRAYVSPDGKQYQEVQ